MTPDARQMTFVRAIAAVLVTALLLAAVGAGVGYVLGRFNPGYYRAVADAGRETDFDPIAVGVGRGMTQGTAGGVLVGLVLVTVLAWRDVRRGPKRRHAFIGGPNLVLVGGWCLLLIIGCSVVAFGLGALAGELGGNHRQYNDERRRLVPALASDPAFADFKIEEGCLGRAELSGNVRSPEEFDRLRAALVRAVGEPRANELIAFSMLDAATRPSTKPSSLPRRIGWKDD